MVSLVSAQLDLSSIKKQQTYPAGYLTTIIPTTTTTTPSTTTTTTTTTSVATTINPCNVGCDEGWIPYNSNCYKKISVETTQKAAENTCAESNAHLVSFETSDEATAIKRLVLDVPLFSDTLTSWMTSSQESWIGLSKTANGAWTWTDSTSVEFTNLPEGESTTGESCAVLNNTASGIWQPVKCTTTTPSFICKKTGNL